jgi:hypothetical protein
MHKGEVSKGKSLTQPKQKGVRARGGGNILEIGWEK